MQQQPTPQDQATLIYRIEVLERLFHDLQAQLQQYVRASENNLHLQAIKETVLRIEQELGLAKNQLTELNAKLAVSEVEAQKRDAAQRESQDKLQIRILWGAVSVVVTILSLVIVNYVTHFIP
jgi:hypothetical protein